jgi:preprotein translocase SecE subunit
MAEQKKNRLVEIFTKDYKYEGLVLLLLSVIAIIVGVLLLDSYSEVMIGWISGKVFGWILVVLGGISLLLSVWPYYKPSVYEVKRVSWPSKKTMFENVLSAFIFTIIFVIFFAGVDLGLKAFVEWIKSWGLYL